MTASAGSIGRSCRDLAPAKPLRRARTPRRHPVPERSHPGRPLRGANPEEAVMASEQRDVIEILEHDHREVEEMFSELESLRGAATDEAKSRRKDLADHVTIEL